MTLLYQETRGETLRVSPLVSIFLCSAKNAMLTGMEYQIPTLAAVATAAEAIVVALPASSTACVLALHGDLGAGKTTFVQTLARYLGVDDTVTSPTFVIMKSYHTTHELFTQLVHIDAYRIDDIDEMRPLRFREILAAPESLVCIEWAERIETLLPEHTIHLTFSGNEETRTIIVS